MSRRIHPAFQTKTVIKLECKYCERRICARGMRALLLADTKVELYSTDLPPEKWVWCIYSLHWTPFAFSFHLLLISNTFGVFFSSIQLIGTDYSTQNCECRIKDVACLGWCVVNSSHAQILFWCYRLYHIRCWDLRVLSLILGLFSFSVEMWLVIMWRFHASRAFVLVTTATSGCFTQAPFIPWKD